MTVRQLLVIDGGIGSVLSVSGDLGPDVDVIVLEPGTDEIAQLEVALAAYSGLASIAIVSHGAPGAMWLGDEQLDARSIFAYAPLLSEIGTHLQPGGDLLLYGCDIAQGEIGRTFVDELADLTGVDVAASTDLTGAPGAGGNWALEYSAGEIAAPEIDEQVLAATGVLAQPGAGQGLLEQPGQPTPGNIEFLLEAGVLFATLVYGEGNLQVADFLPGHDSTQYDGQYLDEGFDDNYAQLLSENLVAGRQWDLLDATELGITSNGHTQFSAGGLYNAYVVAIGQVDQYRTGAEYNTWVGNANKNVSPGVPGGQWFGDSDALVAVDSVDHTLLLTFRGTDEFDHAVPGGQTWTGTGQYLHYEAFRPLIEAAYNYANDSSHHIEHVVVSGHSLGGEMADIFTVVDAWRFAQLPGSDLTVVALGSPGIDPDTILDPPDSYGFNGVYDESVADLFLPFDPLPVDRHLFLTTPADYYYGFSNSKDRVHFAEESESYLLDGEVSDLEFNPNEVLAGNSNFSTTSIDPGNTSNWDSYYSNDYGATEAFYFSRGFGAHHNKSIYAEEVRAILESPLYAQYDVQNIVAGIGEYASGSWFTGDSADDLDARKLIGTASDDFILGLAGNDDLNGDDGNDLLDGGPGDDELYGQAGQDWLAGGDGNDDLYGGELEDRLFGGDGRDSLNGGLAVDELTGGLGPDTFVITRVDEVDRVLDYKRGSGSYNRGELDVIDLSHLVGAAYAGGAGQPVSSLVRTVAIPGTNNLAVQVDEDGSGALKTWTTVASLAGVSAGEKIDFKLDPQSNGTDGSIIARGAAGSWWIDPGAPIVSESTGTITFNVHRPETSGAQTVYVSTIASYGQANSGDFDYWQFVPVLFNAGESVQTVGVQIHDDSAPESPETFGLIVQESPNQPANKWLASTTFTIDANDQGGASPAFTSGDDVVWVAPGAGLSSFNGLSGNDRIVIDFSGYAQDVLTTLLAGDGIRFGTKDNSATVEIYSIEAVDVIAGDGNAVLQTRGGNDALIGNVAADSLDGAAGNDVLVGGEGDDSIKAGTGIDVILAGADSDQIELDEVGGDVVDGGAGDDYLRMNAGALSPGQVLLIDKGSESDTLILSDGTSVIGIERWNLTTGSGDDELTYVAGATGIDSWDAGGGLDRAIVDFSGAATKVTGAPLAGSRFDVGTPSGSIPYTSAIQLYNVDRYTLLGGKDNDYFYAKGGNDVLIGGLGNDTLYGDAGDDLLDGGGGDDTLDPGSGVDTIDGGAGSDYLILDRSVSSQDMKFTVDMTATGGTAFVLPDGTSVNGVERWSLVTGSGADELTYVAGAAGISTWDALGGGHDRAIVDFSGFSTPVTGTSVSGTRFDVGTPSGSSPYVSAIQLTSVEHFTLRGGSGNDYFSAKNGNDVLDGGSGDDTLNGAAGDDRLDGGAGDDSLDPGSGIDTIDGGTGSDYLTLDRSALTQDVKIKVDMTAADGAAFALPDGTSVRGIERWSLTTGSGSDELTYVAGATGIDVWEAGGGLDRAIVDFSGVATNVTGVPGAGSRFDVGTPSGSIPYTSAIQLYNVDRYTLLGGAGNDYFYGKPGNDVLIGGSGNDTMYGDAGDDLYGVDSPGDVVSEPSNAGIDTVLASVSIALVANVENLQLAGEDSLNGTGNSLANVITGNSAGNVLNGAAGNDTIDGGSGFDTAVYSGAKSSYTITRGAGSVTVSGADGTDTLGNVERLNFGDVVWSLEASDSDFNADGKHDLLWENATDGMVAAWTMNGMAMSASGVLTTLPSNWKVLDSHGDYDGDGKTDLLLRSDTDGALAVWEMNGPAIGSSALVATIAPNWTILSGHADFDGHGKSDLLWQNSVDGMVAVWLMNGLQPAARSVLTTLPLTWNVIDAAGDYDGDGRSDVLLRDSTDGTVAVWLMDGTQIGSSALVGTLATSWAIVDAHGDYNGDGRSDVLLRNSTDGMVAMWQMNGTAIGAGALINAVPMNWSILDGHGDYNADGKSDLLWRNTADGMVAVWQMNGTQMGSSAVLGTVPLAWRVLDGHGDYNADGKSDLLWRNSADGMLAVWQMNGTALGSSAVVGTIPTNWGVLDATETGASIKGDGNDNTLWGTVSNDVIAGSAGNDTLTGNAGNDWFVFDTIPNATTNTDTIRDFEVGVNKLVLAHTMYAALAVGNLAAVSFHAGAGIATAADGDDYVNYNTTTGALYYDADGTGATAPILIATLIGAPAISAADFQVI